MRAASSLAMSDIDVSLESIDPINQRFRIGGCREAEISDNNDKDGCREAEISDNNDKDGCREAEISDNNIDKGAL